MIDYYEQMKDYDPSEDKGNYKTAISEVLAVNSLPDVTGEDIIVQPESDPTVKYLAPRAIKVRKYRLRK